MRLQVLFLAIGQALLIQGCETAPAPAPGSPAITETTAIKPYPESRVTETAQPVAAPASLPAMPPKTKRVLLYQQELDSLPKVVFRAPARYPENLQRLGIEGTVVIQFVVDSAGDVHEAQVARGPKPVDRELGELGVEAISQWKFEPGMKDGKAVDCLMIVPISFRAPRRSDAENERP